MVARLAGRNSWNASITVKALRAGADPTAPADRLALAYLFAYAVSEWMWSDAVKYEAALRPTLRLVTEPDAAGMVALGVAEELALHLFRLRAYEEAIHWLSACIDAGVRVAELAAARWECRQAVNDPDAEDDWAVVEQTNSVPNAPRARAAAGHGIGTYWADMRFAGNLADRRAAGLARAAEALATHAAGEDLYLATQVRRHGLDATRRSLGKQLVKQRTRAPTSPAEVERLTTRARELIGQAQQLRGDHAADTTRAKGKDYQRHFRSSALLEATAHARETLGDHHDALTAFTQARAVALACRIPGDPYDDDIRRLTPATARPN